MAKNNNAPLSCNIKPPVHVRLGDHKVDFHSGCSVIDITFNTFYVEIGEIHFHNHHTAWLKVQVQVKENNNALREHKRQNHRDRRDKDSVKDRAEEKDDANKGKKRDMKWRTAVNKFQMMPHPHSDIGGEEFFAITRKNMNFDLLNISGLRLVLHQPSPLWKEFKIDDIAIYKKQLRLEPEVTLPTWLGEEHEDAANKKINGITSLATVCSSLQQMWALTDTAHQNQAAANLGRYDIDGSYEINLLSYT